MGMVNSNGGWWGEQCPSRTYGLAHTKDRDCPDDHYSNQCCECGQIAQARTAQERPVPDHAFVPTLNGLCAMADCKQSIESHPVNVRRTDIPADDDLIVCPIIHSTVTPFTACPSCSTIIEPKMVTGFGPQGKPDDRGRGELSHRQKEWLDGWAGWVGFNGAW